MMRRFSGYSTRDAAMRASAKINTNPGAVKLADGSYAGLSEVLLTPMGDYRQYIIGARGCRETVFTARLAGLLR